LPIDPSTAFVSYAREDLELVLRLTKDLKAKGAKVWMDKLDIRLGQRWELEVESALNGCSRMLVIVSPASVASRNVLAEAAFAIDEGKEVIPVLIQECKIPFRLRPFQYADLSSDYSSGLDELLANLMASAAATDIDEQARLEDERKQAAAEQARLEQKERERKATEEKARQEQLERLRVAAEQARLAEERGRRAAEQARLELEERERKATEEKTRQEELERQRIAEQARLEGERKQAAAEQARLEQEERERKATEEKARQEEQEGQRIAAEQARLEAAYRAAVVEQAQVEKERKPLEEMIAVVPGAAKRWKPVMGAVLLSLALGSAYALPEFSSFLGLGSPLLNFFGYAVLIAIMPSAVAWIVAGRLQDRVGPFRIALVGGVLFSIGLFLYGFLHHSLSGPLPFVVICSLGAGAGMAVTVPAIAKCFPRRRGLPVGMAIAASGGGSIMIWLQARLFIYTFHFAGTVMFLAVIFLAMTLTGAFLLRNPLTSSAPIGGMASGVTQAAPMYDFSPGEMLRTRTFWWMWTAYALVVVAASCSIVMSPGVIFMSSGVNKFLMAIGSIAGAVGSGWISDRVGRLRILRLSIGVALAILLLWAMGLYFAWIVTSFVLYACFGAVSSINASAAPDFWGTKNAGINYGLLRSAAAVAGISSAILVLLYQHVYSSRPYFLRLAVLCGVALVCSWLARSPQISEEHQNA